MMTEYDQRAYQQYDQRAYPQHDQRAYQPYEEQNYSHYDQRNYPQYDQQQQQQQQQRSTILERGRAVRLMRNGDPFFTGRTFVINQRKYPMLEVFLDDASQALRANFGAVRCVYTPKNGTRLRDISDFEDHRTYVASGGERFKKLHYLDIAEGKRVPHKGQTSPKLPPVRRLDVEGRALKLARSENMIIYVYRNGDPLTLPAKVLLVKPTLQNWESVLDEVTKKVLLPNTAVLKLYAMNGELITSAQQLEYNGMYAAAGKERFRRIDYPDPNSLSPAHSPKMSRKSSKHQLPSFQPRMRLPPRQRRGEDSGKTHPPTSSVTSHRYAKSDGTNTLTTTATSHGSSGQAHQRRPVREEFDFFGNKPQQQSRRGPTKETDLDRDDGGIYKRRAHQRDQAHEIEETRDTKTDLPVDYREIETVDEENLYGNAGKTPRRQLQPMNQGSPDPRHRSMKSPPKAFHDDDHRYPYTQHRNNGYENDYQNRTPAPHRQQQQQQHQQQLISSGTQTHHDQRKQQQQQQPPPQPQPHHPYEMQDEDSNIDQYLQPSQGIEPEYDDDDERFSQ